MGKGKYERWRCMQWDRGSGRWLWEQTGRETRWEGGEAKLLFPFRSSFAKRGVMKYPEKVTFPTLT